MNKFIITDFQHREVQPTLMPMMDDPFRPHHERIQNHMSFEMTIRPIEIDESSMKKLYNIHKSRRTIELNDSEYADFTEPFRIEFIEFMMEKHPDRILADPEAWDRLVGR